MLKASSSDDYAIYLLLDIGPILGVNPIKKCRKRGLLCRRIEVENSK